MDMSQRAEAIKATCICSSLEDILYLNNYARFRGKPPISSRVGGITTETGRTEINQRKLGKKLPISYAGKLFIDCFFAECNSLSKRRKIGGENTTHLRFRAQEPTAHPDLRNLGRRVGLGPLIVPMMPSSVLSKKGYKGSIVV